MGLSSYILLRIMHSSHPNWKGMKLSLFSDVSLSYEEFNQFLDFLSINKIYECFSDKQWGVHKRNQVKRTSTFVAKFLIVENMFKGRHTFTLETTKP